MLPWLIRCRHIAECHNATVRLQGFEHRNTRPTISLIACAYRRCQYAGDKTGSSVGRDRRRGTSQCTKDVMRATRHPVSNYSEPLVIAVRHAEEAVARWKRSPSLGGLGGPSRWLQSSLLIFAIRVYYSPLPRSLTLPRHWSANAWRRTSKSKKRDRMRRQRRGSKSSIT